MILLKLDLEKYYGLVKRTNAKVLTRSINKIDDIKNL